MAILKRRLHRKNSSGGYDTVHIETSSDLVLMSDGTTTLTSKISSMDSTINGKAASNHTHSGYAAASHSHPDANTSAAGFMSAAMVSKLNGIAAGANKYTHPAAKQCSYAYTHPSTKQCDAAAGNHTHSGYAASSHNHSAANITSGTLAVARGGTGVTSLDALKSALGVSGSVKVKYGELDTYDRTISCGFFPVLVIVGDNDAWKSAGCAIRGMSRANMPFVTGSNNHTYQCNITWYDTSVEIGSFATFYCIIGY